MMTVTMFLTMLIIQNYFKSNMLLRACCFTDTLLRGVCACLCDLIHPKENLDKNNWTNGNEKPERLVSLCSKRNHNNQ